MTWLTWRQFRGQTVIAVAALAVLTIYLVFLGMQVRQSCEDNVECGAGCTISAARDTLENEFFTTILLTGFLVVIVPLIVGAFWEAPLIAREIETGTHRLVWNQSVTRTRWLAIKLAFVVLAGVALTGALSLLLTWAASPYDEPFGQRFDALTFPARNIAPLGYAAFAVVLGTTVGLLTRRTLPAMAVTLAIFVALQILTPTVIRPHLQPPISETVAFDVSALTGSGRLNLKGGRANIERYEIPGAWVLSDSTPLLDESGNQVTEAQLSGCTTGNEAKDLSCITAHDLRFEVSYQPADRYWTFQGLEFGAYLTLSALLAAFAFWRIRRGLG